MRSALLLLFAISFAGLLRGEETGELSPHFTGKSYRYVGEFFRNYVYLVKNEDGGLGEKLKDKQYVADIVTARENVVVLFRRPSDGQLAIVDPSDRETRKGGPGDLKFQVAPPGSILEKAWNSVSKQTGDRIKGKQQQWLSAGLSAQARQTERFYVGAEIKTDPKSSLQFTPLLTVTEERMTLYLDPENKKFAPVATDPVGTPLDPIKYRDMTPGGIGEAVWKVLKVELSK